jgi:hypothetical protein
MAQMDLVCSKCLGRRTVNNNVMKVNSKVMVTTVPPSRPLAYTRQPIFVSASVHTHYTTSNIHLADELCHYLKTCYTLLQTLLMC